MDALNKIRVVTGPDLSEIAETVMDILVVVDRDTIIVNGNMPMPVNPYPKQFFILTTRVEITNLTVNTNSVGRTIYGDVTTLAANTSVGWVYEDISNAWYPLFNSVNVVGFQNAINAKLSANGDGSLLTGLTKTQVGLANVDNTSDASKPVSTAQQSALDTKLATNGNGGSLTGLTKTQVGLSNVDNTADTAKPVSTAQQTALDAKQAALVSATNIKTVNGVSILGAGDLAVNQIASVQWARVLGSNATTTGQALVDVTGLVLPLVANAVYEIEAHLGVQTSAVTTGTAYGINYSAAGAAVEASITGSSNTTTSKTLRVSAFNVATVIYMAGNNQTGGVIVKGIVTTGANAGDLSIRHLKLTSGTSTVFINSYLRTIRIS